jgi:hypothetical protein
MTCAFVHKFALESTKSIRLVFLVYSHFPKLYPQINIDYRATILNLAVAAATNAIFPSYLRRSLSISTPASLATPSTRLRSCRHSRGRARACTTRRTKNANWTCEEDLFLRQLKTTNLNVKWSDIAYYFPTRSQRQITEQWEKVVNPGLIKRTLEEDTVIVQWVADQQAMPRAMAQ